MIKPAMNKHLPFTIRTITLCAVLATLLPCVSALAAPPPYGQSIGGTVFCDFNRDGIQETGEPGLAGVKVTLTGVNVTATAFTDSNGNYLFSELRTGKYTVSVDPSTAPPGCNVILPNCPLSFTGTLHPGQALLGVDFCFGTNGTIGDTVFCDLNRDGIQEPGEPGLQGVKVTLTGNGITETAFTDANGNYLFNELAPGTYTVSVDPTTAPPGCNIILPNCPLTRTVDLALGQNFLDADFCFGQSQCLLSQLGAAGTYGFAILGLQGANIQLSSGPLQVNGNVGIGVNGLMHLSGGATLQSTLYADPSATVQIDGGSSFVGGTMRISFTAIQSGALALSASAALLPPTQTFSQIQTATTIVGNGGQNVIAVNGQIHLSGGQNLTISGGPNDTFIFNCAQGLQLDGGANIILNGVSPNTVLFNFPGTGQQVQTSGKANTAGIFLAPNEAIQINGGVHNSLFISGGALSFQSNPIVNQIPPCP